MLELYRSTIRDAAGKLSAAASATLNEAERDLDLAFIATEVPHAIEQSLDGAQRVAMIVRAMKEFSHPDSTEKTNTDLNRAIESTITVARDEWKYVAEMKTEFDQALPAVLCYPGDINQVILNVLVNAAHSIKEKASNAEKGLISKQSFHWRLSSKSHRGCYPRENEIVLPTLPELVLHPSAAHDTLSSVR